ncbi:MAG: alpha/beta fold hydrolase [Bryobacteraceae bacterium]
MQRRTGPHWGTDAEIRSADGVVLRASWFPTERIEKCVLILHGIGDSRANFAGFALMFQQRGYATLAPDSRAHGESGGDVVTYGIREREDILGWAAWLRERGCTKLYGLGESLGASMLILAAGGFDAIVAESAYADLQEAAVQRLMRMLPLPRALAWLAVTNGKLYARLAYGLNFDTASPLEAIRRTRTPVLLIHGMEDELTPPEHSRRLAAANKTAELWLVARLGHGSAYAVDESEYKRRVFGWFEGH